MGPKQQGPQVDSTQLYEFPYTKPEEKSFWEAFGLAIWDPETYALFGRTIQSWGGIILFYSVFFSALAALFAVCMYGMMSVMSPDYPRYQLAESIIGSSPGMNYYELSQPLDPFLQEYDTSEAMQGSDNNRVVCGFDSPAPSGKNCGFDASTFGPCAFNSSSFCIYIKLNRIFNWTPEPYNETTDLPADMDANLKGVIESTPANKRNGVWVSCSGDKPQDKKNLGDIEYFPQQLLPSYYFPYTNTRGYLNPLVAVQFKNPKENEIIMVECRAWAKNIVYQRIQEHRKGSILFQLQNLSGLFVTSSRSV